MLVMQTDRSIITPLEFVVRLARASALALAAAGFFSFLLIVLTTTLTIQLYRTNESIPIRRPSARRRVIAGITIALIFGVLLYYPRVFLSAPEPISRDFVAGWGLSVLSLVAVLIYSLQTYSRRRLKRPNALIRRWLGPQYIDVTHNLVLAQIRQDLLPKILGVSLFIALNIVAEDVMAPRLPVGASQTFDIYDTVLLLVVAVEAALFWIALRFQRWLRPERYLAHVSGKLLACNPGDISNAGRRDDLIPARRWRKPSAQSGHNAAVALERYAERAAARLPVDGRESFVGVVRQLAMGIRTTSHTLGDSQTARARLTELLIAAMAITTTVNLMELAARLQLHFGTAHAQISSPGKIRRSLEAVGFAVQNGWPAIKIVFWLAVVVGLLATGQLERVIGMFAGQIAP